MSSTTGVYYTDGVSSPIASSSTGSNKSIFLGKEPTAKRQRTVDPDTIQEVFKEKAIQFLEWEKRALTVQHQYSIEKFREIFTDEYIANFSESRDINHGFKVFTDILKSNKKQEMNYEINSISYDKNVPLYHETGIIDKLLHIVCLNVTTTCTLLNGTTLNPQTNKIQTIFNWDGKIYQSVVEDLANPPQ